ncbi:hypothetical protein SLE2022_082230 [Rubroshorea leprosula]|uniref:Uncharacterized protein n=1 Tax=Rubroshorea leprosula TaxID=152421 RepID=A0AAV5K1C8_9ROSI|nr:hypothetical protein SLEP1_g28928 [Rubroshorea leprosula]
MAGVNEKYIPHWPPYPPCVNEDCDHTRFPELVGKKFDEAKAVIHRDAPYVTIIKLGPDVIGLTDFCCNRVYVRTDKQDIVVTTPEIG